eukprot:CAMPEP_0185807942 /NCGR_PEP_ID=MMETSP1322-20130828/5314_1 /TAXON_ID=265543 /ORGANISM="Minutocellus polymorphus, Strain RCC2270" /LENGTH=147 /DNA_ID=CAMNT_0028504127 /DNA_START=27 /DNA_END=470 /DNA_ORIENTATION=-
MKASLVPATAVAAAACIAGPAAAFAPQVRARSATALQFGIPKWMDPTANQPEEGRGENPVPEKKIGLSGLAQLITAGMGSPFLGDFEGVDKETGKMMFSLEANNLVDEDGKSKQTSMPYFESGWVDPKDAEKERQKKEKGGGGFKFW